MRSTSTGADPVAPARPADPRSPRVPRPLMYQTWRQLTFLHWRYPVDVVQPLLPAGLTAQTRDGYAWVGLIPFLMDDVRAPGVPALPWLSRFPETNVRTYVCGPDGGTGIWFFSLDASRLAAVAAARLGFGLPYVWSAMTVRAAGTGWAYRSHRHLDRPAYSTVTVRPGPAMPDPGPLDRFLTARFRLYSRFAGRLVAAEVEHGAWPLRRATVTELDQNLLQAAGLPAPTGEPLVHASAGVRVRIGRWRSVPIRRPAVPDLDEGRTG